MKIPKMNVPLCQTRVVLARRGHMSTRMGTGLGLLLGLVACSPFMMGFTWFEQKSTPDPSVHLNDAMNTIARDIGKATLDMTTGSPITVTFPTISDVRFQTPCEPLSGFLKDALRRGLSRVGTVETKNIRWVDGHAQAPQGALVVQWEMLNDSKVQLTAHIWDLRQKPERDVATFQQPLNVAALSEDARKVCLFKAKPIDRRTQAGRPLLVRTAPTSEAALIEDGGQIVAGTPLWVEARIDSNRWWLVRLDDNDNRVPGDRVRRGFVYGPIGPTRHAIVEVQGNETSLIQVAERQIQEKLTDSGITFHSGGRNEKTDMRLRMTVTPSERLDGSNNLVAVEVHVTLAAEDLSTTPAVVMAQVDGHGKSLLSAPRDRSMGLEQATQEATKHAAQALITAIEQRL